MAHPHVWHGDRPSNVRCGEQGCDARPSKVDIERVRIDEQARRAQRWSIRMTHERLDPEDLSVRP